MKPYLWIVEPEVDEQERIARVAVESGWIVRRFSSIADFERAKASKEAHFLIYKAPSRLSDTSVETEITRLRAWRESHKGAQLLLIIPKELTEPDRLALILGARHILHEPWQDVNLAQILAMAAQGIGKRERRRAAEKIANSTGGFEEIIGTSKAIISAIEIARKVAAGDTTSILITGECGTGKGSFARAIHLASPRREGPYIEINCAAIPRNLLESEFFGY